VSILLAALAAILFACGAWLLMQRRLSRIIIGVGLLGHGANVLLITSGGGRGRMPIIGSDEPLGAYADPLPQALALTAIVITFGVTTFLLALGYRSWQITRDDRVEDDVEDRLVSRFDDSIDAGDAVPVDSADDSASDAGDGAGGEGATVTDATEGAP
jgi:multicomponent Na+:H+ antiporter subunit C